MKTADLTAAQLDALVSKLEGRPYQAAGGAVIFSPTSDGGQAVPIMDREGIHVAPMPGKGSSWCAIALGRIHERANGGRGTWVEGPNLLIAAMRAYAVAKVGPQVDVPPTVASGEI